MILTIDHRFVPDGLTFEVEATPWKYRDFLAFVKLGAEAITYVPLANVISYDVDES